MHGVASASAAALAAFAAVTATHVALIPLAAYMQGIH